MLVFEVCLDKIMASVMIEIPRQRTRKGQPRCFNCGRTGNLAINGSERKEASPQPLPQKSYPARRSYYQPHFSYNQPRDGYQNSPQQHRRDLNLAVLDEHLSNEDFIAEPERNTTSQVSTDSQEPFHKKGKIMQSASVNIIASETVMSSKQKSRNSQTSHRRLTPRCLLPLPGKINQNISVRQAHCRTRNSTISWSRSRTCENSGK